MTTISLKEAYAKRQTARSSEVFDKNFEYMLEHFVALEDIEPSSPTFNKVLEGLVKVDERLHKLQSKLPVTVATAENLWENLRKSVEVKKPVVLEVKKSMVELLGFYSTLYDLCSYKVNPTLVEAFKPTKDIVFEHIVPATWENPQILQEFKTVTDRDAVSLVFGLSPIKPPIGLKETKNVLLTELKVEVEQLKELNNAIQKLQGISNKFPMLTALNSKLGDLIKNLSTIISGGGNIVQGGYIQARSTLGSAVGLYDAMQEFFTQDLKIILGLPEFATAKQQPSVALKDIHKDTGGNETDELSKIKKVLSGRLTPSAMNTFFKYITGGSAPQLGKLIDVKKLVEDFTNMTYQELQQLSGAAASLPPAKQVDAATGPALQAVGQAAQGQGQAQPDNGPDVDTSGPTTPDKLQAMIKKHNNDLMKVAALFQTSTGKPLSDASLVFLMKKHAEGKEKEIMAALTKIADTNQKNQQAQPQAQPVPQPTTQSQPVQPTT